MHRVSKLRFNPQRECSGQLIMWQKVANLLQTLTIDMGPVLHSKTVAVDIIEHTSLHLKKKKFNQNYIEQK